MNMWLAASSNDAFSQHFIIIGSFQFLPAWDDL